MSRTTVVWGVASLSLLVLAGFFWTRTITTNNVYVASDIANPDSATVAIGADSPTIPLSKVPVHSKQDFEFIGQYYPHNGVVVEVGVHLGSHAREVLRRVAPAHLFLVDPWKHFETDESPFANAPLNGGQEEMNQRYQYVHRMFQKEIEENQVTIYRNLSTEAAGYFKDRTVDIVYIDACHWHSCVVEDLKNYAPKVKPQGLLCGHDYTGGGDHGVKQAVDEFVKATKAKLKLVDSNFCLRGFQLA